jgi:3-oxoacyl-[acyl-carrier protein] reductase
MESRRFPSVVLVTGATSGIGSATCIEIAPKVKKIIAIGRNQVRMSSLINRLSEIKVEVEIQYVDFFNAASFNNFLEYLSQSSSEIEGVVHTVGGMHKLSGLSGWSDYTSALDLNLGFSHRINIELFKSMTQNDYGKIVHVSSLVTKSGIGLAPYVVSKSAIESYVVSFSRDISKINSRININCVAPGPIDVEHKGLSRLEKEDKLGLEKWLEEHGVMAGRLGKTKEIARAIDFLLGDGSDFMHGSVLRIDGGGK